MKRLISLILCLLFITLLVPFASAGDGILLVDSNNASGLVVDEAGLLSEEEKAELSQLAREITDRQGCDVAIVTVNGLGYKSAEAFADDYYDENGFGSGTERSGILFLISMEDRDFAMSTRGEGIDAFSDNGMYYIFDKLRYDLSNGNYYDAFRIFLQSSNSMLNVYRGTATEAELSEYGSFFGSPEQPVRQRRVTLGSILLALGIGFLVAFLPMAALKAQVSNVRKKTNASSYVQKGSLHMDVSRDVVLYANTTYRVIQRDRPTGGGGGSSTHISSSGATHGGISGKF